MEDIEKLTDEQLADYIRTKDQEAYREIMKRYQDKLLRYAHYLTHDEMEAADVVQNSFIKAFVNLNGFNTKRKFSSWMYRIVHNEAMSAFAKHKHEVPMLEDMDFESEENIETNFSREELRTMVNKCLFQMPSLYAEPLSLFFLEDKSYQEISDILRIPMSTVGTRISRAKILMKKICTSIKK